VASERVLHAGPVSVLLDGIDLRYVRIGRVELVRRVYAAVRDRNWKTVAGQVTGLEIDARGDAFDVSFQVSHRGDDIEFDWAGTISGDPSGRIAYSFDGRAGIDMQYNRIGLCVHHPWRELAGAPFLARTSAGATEGVFPDLIAPQRFEGGFYQPLFPAFDRIEIEVAGGSLLFELEGDQWETEDQRNWTDASFKTYSTPMALGFPHDVGADGKIMQRLTIVPTGIVASAKDEDPVRLSIGAATGTTVPVIGLGQASHEGALSDHEAELLATLAPGHLRVEVRLDREDWREAIARGQAVAARVGCALELALYLRPEHEQLLADLSSALRVGPRVDRVLVMLAGGRTATPDETTPSGLVDTVRAALAGMISAAFVGGTEMYFSEINRTRPRAASWNGVCFSISPEVHAVGDLDVIETLDAQGETVRSARALPHGKPVIVSPVTLRPRVNFYATTPVPKPEPDALPDTVDVRQTTLFGAAWTTGSLKYLSEAGATSVTYYETTGWRGVVERDEGSPLPNVFPSRLGQVFPLYHPIADVAGWRGAEVLACDSTDRLAAIGFCVRGEDGGLHLLVANLTPRTLDVTVGAIDGAVRLRRLREATAAWATLESAAFRASSTVAEAEGALALRLDPHELVRIDAP
jgi:D-apionolactonase